jgi:ADP-ribose pyrophosphatase YjhB (NUDIX family)
MKYTYPFRMSSNTATVLVIDRNIEDYRKSKVCIGIRGRNVEVHPGKDSLPGGFMEAKFSEAQAAYMLQGSTSDFIPPDLHPGETLEETALRELLEELCTEFTEDQLTQYHTCSKPGLDPRAHVVNLCFYLEATSEQVASITAGDDLEEIIWWDVEQCLALDNEIAFNHRDLMQRGIKAWLKEERYKELEAMYG